MSCADSRVDVTETTTRLDYPHTLSFGKKMTRVR
jgi:hypothetical protein